MSESVHPTLRKDILNGTSNRFPPTVLQASRQSGVKASRRKDEEEEIVPDSEEERERLNTKLSRSNNKAPIDISSDEDESADNDPFTIKPGACKASATVRIDVAPKNHSSPRLAKISTLFRPSRKVVVSSDEGEQDEKNEPVVLELTDSDDDDAPLPIHVAPCTPSKASGAYSSRKLALYADSDESDSESPAQDEGLLILNDPPRSKRKPIPVIANRDKTPSTPQRLVGTIHGSVNVAVNVQVTPYSSSAPSASRRQPRTGKKAEAVAKLERLKNYANDRFAYLNEKVFENKIPATTPLEWNVRFTTTAGRAFFRRDREGVIHSKIQLASKILDSEERIDRTLSHEMCHLASWIISEQVDEHHGDVFKGWAAKVERTCPGIVVSTTHDYHINHPFNYKCNHCSYIYGRFSKSIKSGETMCGTCEKGLLIAQFEEGPKRTPGTPRISRMAATKSQDSPSARIRKRSPVKPGKNGGSFETEIVCVHGSDSELESGETEQGSAELDFLATKMASASIA